MRSLLHFFTLFLVAAVTTTPVKAEQVKFECASDKDCMSGGTCVGMQTTDHYCSCPQGWGGVDCSRECDRICDNGGSCRFHDSSDTSMFETYCECPPHQFEGLNCEIPFTVCPGRRHMRCFYGGTCARVSDGYECDCPADRQGEFCQLENTQGTPSRTEDGIGPATTAPLTSPATSPATTTASSSNNDNNDSEMQNEVAAVLLLAAALVGAGIVTLVAMCWCRPKSSPIDTREESDVMMRAAEEANWN